MWRMLRSRLAPRISRFQAILAVLLLASAGCSEFPDSARQTLDRARRSYASGKYADATTKASTVIASYPQHADTAGAYFVRALCFIARSNKMRAGEDIQQCIRLSRDRTLTAKAHAMSGALLFESGNDSGAVRHYEKALKHLPEERDKDLVHYRYGICLQRVGRWDAAKGQFATVFRRYPKSSVAELARRHHAWPHDYFVVQCGAYGSRESAAARVRELRRHGLTGRIETRTQRGRTMQMVYEGRYPTFQSARRSLGSVRRRVGDVLIAP